MTRWIEGELWRLSNVMARALGYHISSRTFGTLKLLWRDRVDIIARLMAERGVTQGDIPSSMIFNIVVDCVIQTWELEISDGRSLTDEAVCSLVAAIFYVDDGLIASYQPELAQDSIDYMVELFQRI
jgi:hypothetical protein